MKKILSISIILGFFAWFNMATKRNIEFPCEGPIWSYMQKDSITRPYYMGTTHDTVMVYVYKDTLLDKLANDLCGLLKDSCKMQGFKIQIRDSTSDPAQWNVPNGKQIYFKVCP